MKPVKLAGTHVKYLLVGEKWLQVLKILEADERSIEIWKGMEYCISNNLVRKSLN